MIVFEKTMQFLRGVTVDITKSNSHEIIDPQAQRIVDFLEKVGLPHEGIIAAQDQRKIVGDNLQQLIESLPPAATKDARYLSKFVVGAGVGLFDYSLNAIWNEVVLNLRQKVIMYGIDIFYDSAVGGGGAREFYKTADDLSTIKDSVLLTTCRKLELISNTTYKKLKHILEMRNDIGISHPNDYTINAYELLGYLQNCIADVLNDKPTEAALQVQAFIQNIKASTSQIDAQQTTAIEQRIAQLSSTMCGSLLRTLFGIYVAEDCSPVVRKNISLVAPSLWNSCQDEPRYKLGIVLEGYNVNLHQGKYKLGEQFFDFVQGNAFRSPSERVIIVDELITELTNKHNGWDNFACEAPVASRLYSYVPDQSAIFDNLAQRLFQVILMCRVGRGVSYCQGVSPGGRPYYDAILMLAGDKFAPHAMSALSSFEIKNKLNSNLCRTHAVAAMGLVRSSVINERLLECLDYLIANLEANRAVVDDVHFREVSKGYINWL